MANSIVKPPKPYPTFPMYAHASKRWAAKIKGVTRYFGHWNNWEAALERYQYEVHYLKAGKTPPPKDVQALKVGDMVNLHLEHKDNQVKSGEISPRTWQDSKTSGELLIASLGRHTTIESLVPNDFAKLRSEMAKRVSLATLGVMIQRCRVFFNWAFKNELIEKPVRFGTSFDKPGMHSLAKEQEGKTVRIFSIDELTTIYKAASPELRCFMLLGLNAGFGNCDVGQLKARHIQDGWVRFPRPKTSVYRECPLWKETILAIQNTKNTDSELLFPGWHKSSQNSVLGKRFAVLLDECNLHKPGRSFYALRHCFRTVADGSRDRVACDVIMGHSDRSMGANYRHGVEPERLQAVVDHVRKWCLPMLKAAKSGAK